MTEEENIETKSFLQKMKSGTSNLGGKIKTGFKSFKAGMKNVSLIQLLVALVIFIVGIVFTYIKYNDEPLQMWLLYLMIFGGAGLSAFIWVKFTKRFLGRIIYLLCEHKYARKVIAGGSFSYFEYKDPAIETTKSKMTEPLGITISSLITLLGLAATIIGLLGDIELTAYVWGAMAIAAPLLATPVIPVIWALDDAKVKAWNSKNNTTWTVSSKYKRRFNSIIAVSAVVANLSGGFSADAIFDQIEIFLGILGTGALILLITMSFFIIYYYASFRTFLRTTTTTSLNLTCYDINLVEREDVKQFEGIVVEEEAVEKSKSELEKVAETEETIEEIQDEEESTDEITEELPKEDSVIDEVSNNHEESEE